MRTDGPLGEIVLALFGALLLAIGHGGGPSVAVFEVGPRPSVGLRVLTWNVGSSGSEEGSALPDADVSAVAETLRLADADLIVLQEVADERQIARLSALLREYGHRASDRNGRRVVVFARRGKLEDLHGAEPRLRRIAAHWRFGGSGWRGTVDLVALHANAYSCLL